MRLNPARLWRSTAGLVAFVATLFALTAVVIGAIAYEITHEALEQQLDHRIATETHALLVEGRGTMTGIEAAVRRRSLARSTASLDYILVASDGRVVAASIAANVPATPGFEEFLHYRRAGTAGIAQALTTRLPAGTLVVAADRNGLNEIDRTLAMLFAGSLAAMLALGIAAAALVGWETRRRLARIDATALAIIDGDFSKRVPQDGSHSEFDQLGATINRMLDRIAALLDNLRQVSNDVAHDLRTPLTRLSAHLDAASTAPDAATREQAIITAREEASELLETFAALLRIAEIEANDTRLKREVVDVSALVEQMAETYGPDIEASGHVLAWRTDPGIAVRGDRRLLSQAITNLLDNCLRHTPAGTRVSMIAECHGGDVAITVSDNGPGIAREDRARIFHRFARGEGSRSTEGNGLGLALVAAVATFHAGTAKLIGEDGFGIRLTLPEAAGFKRPMDD